jgi:hypothetical protein
MVNRDDFELELIRAQIALQLRQTQTEFWKIGVACVAAGAGAVVGGVLIQVLQ